MSTLISECFPEIKHLSASSLNKWSGDFSDEGLWCLSYLYGKKFEGNEATIRGHLVEDCFLKILMKKDNGAESLLDFCHRAFVERCGKLDSVDQKKFDKEHNSFEGFIEQSYLAIMENQLVIPKDVVKQTQVSIRTRLSERIPLDTVGYIDFDFGSYALDLKTTHSVPSKDIKPDHKRQISLYAKARKERTAKILYISSKKYKLFGIHDREIDSAFDELVFRGESLCDRLEAAALIAKTRGTDPKLELARLITPNTSSWNWGDEEMAIAADNNLWNIKRF